MQISRRFLAVLELLGIMKNRRAIRYRYRFHGRPFLDVCHFSWPSKATA
uniref:Uncharacterized protein n=1 Tax=Rhizophora mucronata TaxID=61149 RepID=A0A2P2JMS1_RHIMU